MRVLTTWMYFDKSQVNVADNQRRFRRGREGDANDLGVGVGWFAGDTPTLMDISNLKAFRSLRGTREETALTEPLLLNLADLFLMDADEFEFRRLERSLKNPAVAEYIITQPIVIERSPPVHVTLKWLLTTTNLPIWIGTYMGWSVAPPEHPVLLFITVPGGIITVASATGLATALASGLSTSVKRLFHK